MASSMTSFPRFLVAALLAIALLWALWLTHAITFSFAKLGVSPEVAVLILLASLLGGYVNLPIVRRRIVEPGTEAWRMPVTWQHPLLGPWRATWPWDLWTGRPGRWWGDLPLYARFLYYTPPIVRHQVIAINVGGALVPLLFGAYLVPRVPVLPLLGATAGVAAICYAVARPTEGVGVLVPTLVPPLAAALLAILLAPDAAAPVAYIAGTFGTLVGADLLHLPELRHFKAQVLSIGGAGVHDAIFFAGLVAALLA